jgi:signal peptidase I
MRRRVLGAAATLAVISLAVVLLRYQGLLFPVRIASGSMADVLVGPHRLVQCADCRFEFRCGIDTEATLDLAVCPNCGFGKNELSAEQLLRGQRVVIDRWSYLAQDPQRRDVVAFVDPADETQLAVKRIVGLPAESIAIQGGELFINDQIYRKTLAETKEAAVLVYDDTFRSTNAKLPQRWEGDLASSVWRAEQDGFVFDAADADSGGFDWLMYRHWRCYASPNPRTEEVPAADNYGYNQGLSRQLHEVTDLFLTCTLEPGGPAPLAFLVHDGRESFQAVLSMTERLVKLKRGATLIEEVSLPNFCGAPAVIEFGAIDWQVLLSINGTEVLRRDYEPSDSPLQPTSRPLGIGASSSLAGVSKLKVFRDIYYMNRLHENSDWVSQPLNQDEYLVLGDNVPLSRDSRHWATAGLHRKLLLGKVLAKDR